MIVVSSEIENYPDLESHNDVSVSVPTKVVPVKALRRNVHLQGLNGKLMNEYRKPMFVINGTKMELSLDNNNLRLLAYAMVRKDGSRMYPNAETGVKLLAEWPAQITEELAKHARELSGLGDDDAEKIEGESEGDRTSSSSSGSPSPSDAPSVSSDSE